MILLVDIGNSQINGRTIKSKGLADSENFARPKAGIQGPPWKSLEILDELRPFCHNVAVVKKLPLNKIPGWMVEKTNIHAGKKLTPVLIKKVRKRRLVDQCLWSTWNTPCNRSLVAIIAGRQTCQKEVTCIMKHVGTAITIDILTEKGQHQEVWSSRGLSWWKGKVWPIIQDALTDAHAGKWI